MKLSPQEQRIVVLVGRDGLGWSDVEDSLDIAPSTRKTHVKRILAKHPVDRPPREALTVIYFRSVTPEDDAPEDDCRDSGPVAIFPR